ncbi:RICIN domain-containing protein [Noviherbaspirillum sp.]|uniref:RICIN domain-containing protein n=1 Tax=Noviherbaspirillum sp. TaxID=1926288 RepID=UPI002FE40700
MIRQKEKGTRLGAGAGYGFLSLLLVACGGGSSSTSPQAGTASGASLLHHSSAVSTTTHIIAEHSSQCLDVRGGAAATQDGALIEQWTCTGQANQDWTLVSYGNDNYALQARSSGKCIEPVGGNTANETRIQQSTCNGSPNQLWNVRPKTTGRYEIVHAVAGRCLDVIGGPSATQEGVLTELWDCTGQANQSWALSLPASTTRSAASMPIIARHSNKCLDVMGDPTATRDGALIEQWSCTGLANQDWLLRERGAGAFELVARSSGKCLDVRDANPNNEAVIQQWSCNGAVSQLWRMEPLSNRGEYRFRTALAGGRCLDVRGGTAATQDGALMELWDCTGQDNQTWTIGGGTLTAEEQGDGMGTAAYFAGARGIARDGAGNLIVADQGHHTIRRIAPDGSVTTIAGAAGRPGYVDAEGSAARFMSPTDVAVDRAGNIYVVEAASSAIRKITPSGVVTTLAGSFTAAGNGDGLGTSARFNEPEHLVVDSAGNILVVDVDRRPIFDNGYHTASIRRITPDGTVSTYPTQPSGHPYAPALQSIRGLGIDAQDNLYVSNLDGYAGASSGGARGWGSIDRIAPAGQITYFGGGGGSQVGGGLYEMSSVTVDNTGRVLVVSQGRITQEGSISTVRNPGIYVPAQNGGTQVSPQTGNDLVSDAAGNIYLTHFYGVWRIAPDGSLTRLAGAVPKGN